MTRKLLLDKVQVEGIAGYDVYRKNGGYRSVEKALKTMSPDDVVEEVKKSGLRGRGGAGSHRNEMEFFGQTRWCSQTFALQCRRE
jgi:NADH:ubiquinone oxidoreductase subunit F (NADH-binding)